MKVLYRTRKTSNGSEKARKTKGEGQNGSQMPAFDETWNGDLYTQTETVRIKLERGEEVQKTNVDMVLLAIDPRTDVDDE